MTSDDNTRVFVSIASAWELAIKQSIGKLDMPEDLQEQLDHHRFELLPVTLTHTSQVAKLPLHHRDPFDRILIAQALSDGLTIVARDRNIARYEVPVLAA